MSAVGGLAKTCAMRSSRTTKFMPKTLQLCKKTAIGWPATSICGGIGAISFMHAASIERYNWVYIQQDYVNAAAVGIITDEPKIGAPWRIAKDPANLTAAEIESMLIGSAEMDIRLPGLIPPTPRTLFRASLHATRAIACGANRRRNRSMIHRRRSLGDRAR